MSGVLALFGPSSPELKDLVDHGVTLVKGEVDAPGILAGILRDALADKLQPIYDITDSPDFFHVATPKADKSYLRRFLSTNAPLDTSRGCPFNCSFCTVINVQGRKMRHRSPESILNAVRANYEAGYRAYFFTDDNMARNPAWEELFDGLNALRQEGLDVRFMMQVDTQAYRIPRFVEKARAGGCRMAFIGLESVNPDNLKVSGKRQNKVKEFADMVKTWHDAGIIVQAGYIIGMPFDTPESVRRDVALLQDVLQVDQAAFFMMTPLPGSRDHKTMVESKVPMDADLNNLDSQHETFKHPHFKPGQWRAAYEEGFDSFYSKENMVNVLLRTPRDTYWHMFWTFAWYRYTGTIARTHPMAAGMIRLKDRKSRRPTFARESLFRYGLRRASDAVRGFKGWAKTFWEFQEIWMLTRKPHDPRWATLAELREKWAAIRQAVADWNLGANYELAAQEMRTMMGAAAERFRALSVAREEVGRGLARKLQKKVREVEAYLKSFDMQPPSWSRITEAQEYIAEGLVSGYEELAIRYVAQRRRMNALRQQLWEHLKKGHIFSPSFLRLPPMIASELLLASRFWYTALTEGF